MHRTVIVMASTLLLGGCAQWQAQQAANARAQQEARNAADDAKCRTYGFVPNTPPYGACRMQLDEVRRQQAMFEDEMNVRRGEALLATSAVLLSR